MKYPVVAVCAKMSKAGKPYYNPTVVLPDGDTFQTYTSEPVKVGDELSFRPAKFTIKDDQVGRDVMLLIPDRR